MAVYRPKNNGKSSKTYSCEFIYLGKRIRESTGCSTKTAAKEYEKQRKAELERAHAGLPSPDRAARIRSISDLTAKYCADYALNHRLSSITYVNKKLAHVDRLLGSCLLADLGEDGVRGYIRKRQLEGVSGRSINMELGELSRAIGYPWKTLWPSVKKLEERKDVGRALSPEEQNRVLDASQAVRSPIVRMAIPLLLLTGLRPGEALSLTWGQIDFLQKRITVGRAKTSSGTGRQIPINEDLMKLLSAHRTWFKDKFGAPKMTHFVFPFGSPQPTNPSRPTTDFSSGWDLVREQAQVRCRLHDLRHTFCTRLAENGVSESTMLSLMGHMSRAMLERYSHIRISAKRDAVASITLRQPTKENPIQNHAPMKVPMQAQNTPVM